MKFISLAALILVFMPDFSLAVTPEPIPWPVGSTPAMMNETKPLMSSYYLLA